MENKYIIGCTIPQPLAGGWGNTYPLKAYARANAYVYGIGHLPDYPLPFPMLKLLGGLLVHPDQGEFGMWEHEGTLTPIGCGRGFRFPGKGDFYYGVAVVQIRGPHLFDDDSVVEDEWPRRCATFARELAIGAENDISDCYAFQSVYSVRKMSAEEWKKRMIFDPYGIPARSFLGQVEPGVGGLAWGMFDGI